MTKENHFEANELKSLRVLVVEDSEDDALFTIRELEKGGYNPVYERVETAAEMKKNLKKKQWDIILCDYNMPNFSAPLAIALLKESNIDIPLIIVSGTIGEETAVECMRLGAHDYFMKGNLSRLCPAIARELEEAEIRDKKKQAEFQREAALEKSRESEERYSALFDRSLDLVYIVDFEGRFIDANNNALNRLGYTREEITSLNFASFLSEDQLSSSFKMLQEIRETGVNNRLIELRLRHKNGSDVYVETQGSTIMSNGIPVAIQAIARDVTERRQTEKELLESEANYKQLFDNSPVGIYQINFRTGKFLKANDVICEYLSCSQEEIPSISPFDFLTKESQKSFLERLNKMAIGDKVPADPEYEFVDKNGKHRWLKLNCKNMYDSEGLAGADVVAHDITDRKRHEEVLKESEKKYRLLADNVNDVIFVLDMNLNYTYVSPSIKILRGYEPEEVMKQPPSKTLTPSSWDLLTKTVAEAMELEKTEHREINISRTLQLEMKRKDGTTVWIEVKASFIRDKDQQPVGILGVTRDITDRMKAEEELRQSEEKYRTILENIEDGYYETDLAGNFTFFNDSLCLIHGYSKEELIGMNNQQYEVKESLKKVFQTYNKVYNTGKPIKGFDREIIRKDGNKRYIEVSVSLQKDSSGKPIGFRGITRDITERKQMEEIISQSEERYRTILDEMGNGYFEVDLAGNYTFVNDVNSRQLGYSKEEMLGLNFRVPMVKESVEIVKNVFTNIYITGKSQRGIAYMARRKDGTTGFAEISGFPLKNKKGEIIGFRGMSLDITERKQMEEKLRQSEEKYRTILEDMEDVYFEVDIKGNITFVNPSACRTSGYSEKELLRMPFKKISAPDGIEKIKQYFGDIFLTDKTGKPFIWNLVKKNGEQGFFEIVASLIRDNEGKPVGFQGIGRDITERRLAEAELLRTLESLRKAFGTTVQVMIAAVEMKDPYTAGHQLRSADLARSIAAEMGLTPEQIDGIRMAGSIHDIGKLSVPSEILSKPTKLTNAEFSLIKDHAQSGYEMLKNVESPWPLAQIVYQHHERMNGTGYPRNLKGDEILLEARVMAVADVVEAMASHRPYRASLGIDVALAEIEKNKGILYDNTVAEACLRLFREKGYKLIVQK